MYITSLRGASFEQPTNNDPWLNGCGWGSSLQWDVPSDLKSGAYKAVLSHNSAVTELIFFVKSSNPGVNAKILCVASVTTWQAYNLWGGKSLYGDEPNWIFENRARKVSFNRPPRQYDFDQWELPFIRWFYKAKNNSQLPENMELEFCTSVDLHAEPELINNYKLVLSIGHDEYWSWEMRDTIENFIAAGGNVAFLSGNVSWWQVRFEGDNEGNLDRTMVCYKDFQEDKVANPSVPDDHITINWFEEIINRPENLMTGVSYYWGTAQWGGYTASYKVSLQRHWLLKDTGLTDRQSFGDMLFNYGFETDSADFSDYDKKFPIPTGKLAYETNEFTAPKDLMIIASVNLTTLGEQVGTYCGPLYHNGWGTMGIYRKRNGGFVFHGGNYNWSKTGLAPYISSNDWNEFCKMTKNVLTVLGNDYIAQAFLIVNADFESWGGNLPTGWGQTGTGTVALASGYTGNYSVLIDSANGETYISQYYIPVRTNRFYRVRCYVNIGNIPENPEEGPGGPPPISVRLQTTDTFNNQDFVIASYPVNNDGWIEITADGRITSTEDIMMQARVKLQVRGGYSAYFDSIVVEEL